MPVVTSKSFGFRAPEVPHLSIAGKGGVGGEVADLRRDVEKAFQSIEAVDAASGSNPWVVEEFTDVPASAPTAIKTAIATVASAQTYTGTALNGAIGVGVISPPRTILVTTAGTTPADAPATATITGKDVNGAAISEAISIAQTATTAEGAKAFASVTSIVLTAADGTGATLAFGTGTKVGLRRKIKVRAGLSNVVSEVAIGAKVSTGTFAPPATGAPNGTYVPAAAFNGTNDFAVVYERDMT